MTYEEKGRWVYLVVAIGVWAVYVGIVLDRADGRPLAEVPYVPTLLWAIGISALLTSVGRVVVEIVRPSDTHRADDRDKDIDRRGEYVAGIVLAVAMLGPFALTLLEADHFWIAHAIYTAFVVAAVVGSLVKIVAYRRGI